METRFEVVVNRWVHVFWLNVAWVAYAIVVILGGIAFLGVSGYGQAVLASWGLLMSLGGFLLGNWVTEKYFGTPTTLTVSLIGLTILNQYSGQETHVLFADLSAYGLFSPPRWAWQTLWFNLTDGRKVRLRVMRLLNDPLGPVAEAVASARGAVSGATWPTHPPFSVC